MNLLGKKFELMTRECGINTDTGLIIKLVAQIGCVCIPPSIFSVSCIYSFQLFHFYSLIFQC